MFALRRITTSAARKSDPIQALFVGKIKEYSKLATAGKLDQAEVNAEIDAAKARLGATQRFLNITQHNLLKKYCLLS